MEKIRTLIVDDEPLAREGIRMLLRKDPDFEVVDEAQNGKAAVEAIKKLRPDLVFLDVQMPHMNGIEVVARLDADHMPVVVFVTAYDQYALEAFEHHALDYLLKPFDDERFEKALERTKLQIQQQKAHQLSRRLLDLVDHYGGARADAPEQPEAGHITRLSIRSAGRVIFLKTSEIDWIEAADYYVKLHVGDKSYLLRESMNRLEERLDPGSFVRIHRSTIVNVERIQELRPLTQGESLVCLHDGTELRASRARREKLHALLTRVR